MRNLYGKFLSFVDRHVALLGLIMAVAVVATVAYVLVEGQRQNRLAIEKNCILLNNAIIRSTTQGSQGGGTEILVREILRNAVQHHRAYVVAEFRDQSTDNTSIAYLLVNCQEVAKHPDKIKAVPRTLPPPVKVPSVDYPGHQ